MGCKIFSKCLHRTWFLVPIRIKNTEVVMQISKICLALIMSSIFILLSCGKDKNMDDFRRDQLQQSFARITSISGSYSGPVMSKVDGSNLGNILLKFKASTDVQSNSGRVSNDQSVLVSGSINLKSLTTTEVTFDNGFYDDVTGDFQVTIPVAQDGGVTAKISLTGHISEDHWIGSIDVKDQEEYGASLNLTKDAPPSNTSSLEVGGVRLQQIKKLDYLYEGTYRAAGTTAPIKMSFINRDIFPEQSLYKLFSPIRQVSVNCDLTQFEVNFSNASLDDKNGLLVAHDPTDQQGHPARASLTCKKFETGSDFGWDCEIQTKAGLIETHLIAKK